MEVYRRSTGEVDITLAAAIPRRRTDRRHYSSWSVPPNYIALMGARAARAGVMLRQIESLPHLQDIVARAVWRHAIDHDYMAELTTWSGRYGSLAGVPARSTPESDTAAPVPAAVRGPALAQPPDSESVVDNAVVLALGTKDDSTLARLRAGEATSLVLLSATALGLASCPVTEPLEVSETRDAVQIEVFGISGFPQMLLRIGWAPVNADPLPATPRRPLNDIVEHLDGSAFSYVVMAQSDSGLTEPSRCQGSTTALPVIGSPPGVCCYRTISTEHSACPRIGWLCGPMRLAT